MDVQQQKSNKKRGNKISDGERKYAGIIIFSRVRFDGEETKQGVTQHRRKPGKNI